MANATIHPSGLTIKRNGALKFALTWKIADKNYDAGHQLRWRIWTTENTQTDWTNVSIYPYSVTSTTINVSASNHYPNTNKPKVWAFEFQVQGKRANETDSHGNVTATFDWSTWASLMHRIRVPNKPTVTPTLTSSNTTSFAYTSEKADDDWRPFTTYEYQSMTVQDCDEVSGKKLNWVSSASNWNTASPTTAGSKSYPESGLSGISLTRWFRIRAKGAAGDSDWTYSKHVYATPYRPKIKSATSSVRSGNTNVKVTWIAGSDRAHPIDDCVVQYWITTPAAGLAVPTVQNPGWVDAVTVNDTSGDDNASFIISGAAGADQVLFVRVVSRHDANTNPSDPVVAGFGTLTAPTLTSATMTTTTKATVVLTNNSTVPDSRVAIIYRDKNGKDTIVAVSSARSASGGGSSQTISNINVPESTVKKFYVYAFQGSYSSTTLKNSVVSYSIDSNMESSKVADSASVTDIPVAPTNLTVTAKANGRAYVNWDMNWNKATATIISWSDYKYAWNSNEAPQTYTRNSDTAHSAYISGIEPGHVWYFRARFIGEVDGEEIRSPLTDRVVLDRTAVPDTPILSLSKGVVRPGGKLKASWTYSSEDETKQAAAEVRLATEINSSGAVTVSTAPILKTSTKKTGTIKTDGLTAGQTYNLRCRVTSNTGKVSDWSDPVPFYVGPALTCTISSMTNIASTTVTDASSNSRTAYVMSALPASVTITGAGAGGTTTLIIERAEDYHMIRPDGSMIDGYKGETVFIHRQNGEAAISIDRGLEMFGSLDDGAQYKMIAIVEDGNGQRKTNPREFEVHWNHQPAVPTANVDIITGGVAKITATAPSGAATGDTVDIYRLSADNPQLIIKGGAFGTAYVDPYPTLGEHGGYRIVDVSKYGDYISAGSQPAWLDKAINLDNKTGYIHFNSETIPIDFNVQVSSAWSKDFKATQYLGGSVRGDWNPAVNRSMTVNVTIPTNDILSIQKMRRLADFAGICHVRTQDGSSFAADVQVTGNASYDVAGKLETYTLKITRVDTEELDGVPFSRW